MSREITCCFTGHRTIQPEDRATLPANLEQAVRTLIDRGYEHFYAGGAMGFDLMAAETVLKLKKEYPHIQLELALPYPKSCEQFRSPLREQYADVCAQADKITNVCEFYFPACFHVRNRYMVDRSSVCVCYLRPGNRSRGTSATVAYAAEQNVERVML